MIISAIYHVYQLTEFISLQNSHKSKLNESNDEEPTDPNHKPTFIPETQTGK